MKSRTLIQLLILAVTLAGNDLHAGGSENLGMVGLPAGSYQRADGQTVRVNAFSLFATDVTWSQFKTVRDWAEKHGYNFEEGIGQDRLPAQNITWYDSVKWCNALSEISGKTPVYYADDTHTQVYRQGREDLVDADVKWDATGFRLPTEAEWEYAYRAGTTTTYYWGNYARTAGINHKYAVFHEWGTNEIDGGPLPVASKLPNKFGLYDMAGNVEEWVWDRYAIGYAGVGADQPHGPDSGPLRVLRGGGFVIDRIFTASARHPTYPFFVGCDIGFRIASSDPQAKAAKLTSLKELPLAANDLKPFSQPEPLLDVRADTDKAACQRLMPLLDLNAPDLQPVRAAWDKKDYATALTALRDLYVARLKAGSLEPARPTVLDMKTADYWLGIYRQHRPIRWAGPNTDLTTAWGYDADSNLAKAWAINGQPEYADAFFWMLNEEALRAKPVWNRLTKLEKGSEGKPRDSYYTYIGFDSAQLLTDFEAISWMLKHERAGHPLTVPPRVLANALYSAVADRLAAGLQDDRANVPNQVWGNAISILEFSKAFPELKDAAFLQDEGINRVRNAAGTVMPDGSDLEASLNYNQMLFDRVDDLNALFPDHQAWPAWLTDLNRLTEWRRYLYVGLTSPFGSFAEVGNQPEEQTRPRKALQDWLDKGLLTGLESEVERILDPAKGAALPAPAFTSVAFPYGGYYAQRSGWTSDDLYLFMRSSRGGVGHNHPDNNNLQLAAYGAWLLTGSGIPAYTAAFMPDDQKIYTPFFNEEEAGGVFSNNDLSVDGLEQGAPREEPEGPTNGWKTPRALRFHTSPQFDLMEGVYDGPYVPEEPLSDLTVRDMIADYGADAMAPVIAFNKKLKQNPHPEEQAVHRRLVFFLRQDKFWAVVDQVDGGSIYTQNWHFPPPDEGLNAKNYICPGFGPDEVRCDDPGKRIVTISHYRPNLAILNFSHNDMRYTKHFGDKFPFRGWHSFGFGGERVPAVTVEGTWRGGAPMVTALYPSKARPNAVDTLNNGLEGFVPANTDTVSGFTFTAKDTRIVLQAARQPQALKAESVRATARVLLVRQSPQDGISGMALGCSAIAIDGQTRQPGSEDFEFTFAKGIWNTTAIQTPETFRWQDDGKGGLVPHYHP